MHVPFHPGAGHVIDLVIVGRANQVTRLCIHNPTYAANWPGAIGAGPYETSMPFLIDAFPLTFNRAHVRFRFPFSARSATLRENSHSSFIRSKPNFRIWILSRRVAERAEKS